MPLFALVLFAACTSDNSIVPVRAVSAHMTSQRPFTRLDGELLSAAQIDELIRRQVEIQSTQFPTLRPETTDANRAINSATRSAGVYFKRLTAMPSSKKDTMTGPRTTRCAWSRAPAFC